MQIAYTYQKIDQIKKAKRLASEQPDVVVNEQPSFANFVANTSAMAAAANAGKGATPSKLMRGYSSFIPLTVQRSPSNDEIGENVSSNRAIASAVFASSRQNLNLPNGFGVASPTAAASSASAYSAAASASANSLAVPAPAAPAPAPAPTSQMEQMNSMMQAMMAQMARQQQLQKEAKEAKEAQEQREKQEREAMLQKMMAQMMNLQQPQPQAQPQAQPQPQPQPQQPVQLLGSSQSQPGLPIVASGGMAASTSQRALPPAAAASSSVSSAAAFDMSAFEQFQKFQKMMAAQSQPQQSQPQSQLLQAQASGMLPVVIAPSPSGLRRLETLHSSLDSSSSSGFSFSGGAGSGSSSSGAGGKHTPRNHEPDLVDSPPSPRAPSPQGSPRQSSPRNLSPAQHRRDLVCVSLLTTCLVFYAPTHIFPSFHLSIFLSNHLHGINF